MAEMADMMDMVDTVDMVDMAGMADMAEGTAIVLATAVEDSVEEIVAVEPVVVDTVVVEGEMEELVEEAAGAEGEAVIEDIRFTYMEM
jgi:hypothetical protein